MSTKVTKLLSGSEVECSEENGFWNNPLNSRKIYKCTHPALPGETFRAISPVSGSHGSELHLGSQGQEVEFYHNPFLN